MTSIKVCLAVSSFRSDDSVIKVLGRVAAEAPDLFQTIFVVDSLGTGAMAARLADLPIPVRYECATENLGSAGNLARRLELAAQTDAEFVYAVNHDGEVDAPGVRTLLSIAEGRRRLGALYPLRRFTARDGTYDLSGTARYPLRAIATVRAPRAALVPVHWSSSNGALYSLEPVRAGLLPPADLWLGYEDLAYGWDLEADGYEQFIVPSVVMNDNYEYEARTAQRLAVPLTDKPAWYTYYFARNLLKVARRARHRPLGTRTLAAARVAAEYAVVLVGRKEKARRLGYLTAGVVDAVRGRSGKWRLP